MPQAEREAKFLTFQKDGSVSFLARMPVRMKGSKTSVVCLSPLAFTSQVEKTGLQIPEQMVPAGD